MKYKPSLTQTAALPSGGVISHYFDHPNHAGLESNQHLEAAHWHSNMAKKHATESNAEGHDFHKAQADLHLLAAAGHQTKIRPVPSDAMIQQRHPNNQDMWRRESEKIKEHNKVISAAEPYRMVNMLKGNTPPDPNKMRAMFKKRMAKSNHTVDLQEVRNVEMDRDPPAPPLQAQDAPMNDTEGYGDMLQQMMAKRKAERHGESGVSEQSTSDPRQKLDADMQDRIKAAVANRTGRTAGSGGWKND